VLRSCPQAESTKLVGANWGQFPLLVIVARCNHHNVDQALSPLLPAAGQYMTTPGLYMTPGVQPVATLHI
jgi:hypothetical protein